MKRLIIALLIIFGMAGYAGAQINISNLPLGSSDISTTSYVPVDLSYHGTTARVTIFDILSLGLPGGVIESGTVTNTALQWSGSKWVAGSVPLIFPLAANRVMYGTPTGGKCVHSVNESGTVYLVESDYECSTPVTGTITSIITTAPITKTGTTTLTISIPKASASVDGYMDHGDFAATEKIANKDAANGYAGLDSSGKLPYSHLSGAPSFTYSLNITGGVVTLLGDSGTPGNNKYYGTNSAGTNGFYSLGAVALSNSYNSLDDLPSILTSGRLIKTTALTSSSGTFTTTATTSTLYVRMVGGGGGGGGCSGLSSKLCAASGGASAAYLEKTISVSANTGYSYAVGSGGSGGIAANGSVGGNTHLVIGETTLQTNGGNYGYAQTASSVAITTLGGAGGAAAYGGDIGVQGTPGGGSICISATVGLSGAGAQSPFGGGGRSQVSSTNGGDAFGYGAGGGGSLSIGANNTTGGAGGSGLIIIQEYSN